MRHRGWRRQADARLEEFAAPGDPVRPHPQAILADDELIDSVLQERLRRAPAWPGGQDPDELLAAILSAWRSDAGAEPVRQLISVEAAQAAIGRGRAQRRLRPLALVAALLLVVGTGLTIAAGAAQPGNSLWGLSRVVDGDRAESVTVALKVQSQLSTVRTALAQGRPDVAAATLAEVRADLPAVRPEEGRDALAAEQRDLAAQLAQTPPAGPSTPPDPRIAEPAPSEKPPPEVRAQEPRPGGPPAASEPSNQAVGPPPNQTSSGPPPAQQQQATPPSSSPPSNPPANEPPPSNPPANQAPGNQAPGNQAPAGGPSPNQPAQDASGPTGRAAAQQQQTSPAPARKPLVEVQLGNLRIGLL